MTPISTEFEFTLDIYKKALRLHYRQSLGARIYRAICLWLFPALGLTSWLAWAYLNSTQQEASASAALSFGTVFPIWYVIALIVIEFSIRRMYKTTFPANSESRRMKVDIEDGGLSVSVPSAYSSHLEWRSLSKWVENEDFILIYMNKSRFIPLPQAELHVDEVRAIRETIQTRIQPR